jgi:hypothetical protein
MECHGLKILCSTYLHEVVYENSPSDHEAWSIQCHARIHVDFHIHLAFTYILRWSLNRSVKRTWTGSAFSTNEHAWSVMVMGFQSHVWSGPEFPFACHSKMEQGPHIKMVTSLASHGCHTIMFNGHHVFLENKMTYDEQLSMLKCRSQKNKK